MSDSLKAKYIPSWKQQPGKITKSDKGIIIHPYDLISMVQKKKGLDQAADLAVKLLNKKYNAIFDDIKEGN